MNVYNKYETPTAEISSVLLDAEEIKEKLRSGDAQFFIDIFLPEEDIGAIPAFHQLIWDYMLSDSHNKTAIAVPRGHGKTTWAKLFCVYQFIFTPVKFIVYLSDTHTVASHACSDVMNIIESPNFENLFGKVKFLKYQESSGYYQFILGNKTCMLKAFGSQQQIRGMNIDNTRPEIAIVDDLEDADQVKTDAAKEQLKLWFFGTFLKAMARNNRVVMIGNMTAADCLIAEIIKLPTWRSIVMSQLVEDSETGKLVPIWPEKSSMDDILAEYTDFKRMGIIQRWYAEGMNMPVNLENAIIDFTKLLYAPHGEFSHVFITIDPAFTQNTNSDESAIVVHGFNIAGNHWQIIDHAHGKFAINELYGITLAFMQKYKTTIIAIESNGAQKVLILLFETYFANAYISNYEIIPILSSGTKLSRILVFCAYLEKGTYRLSIGEMDIVSQMTLFNPRNMYNKDDLIDSCAMGVFIIEHYFDVLCKQVAANFNTATVLINHQVGR